MQMRFDGRLGFPGGFVDDDDPSLEAALNRELKEEMGNLPEKFEITAKDYLTAYLFGEKKYCLHFYAKEVSFEDYLKIESRDDKQLVRDFEVKLYIFSLSNEVWTGYYYHFGAAWAASRFVLDHVPEVLAT